MYALHRICQDKNIDIVFLQGYDINWPTNNILKHVNLDVDFIIQNYYRSSKYYQQHDHTNENTVPCVDFQKYLAFKINSEFLHFDLSAYYNKFKW